VSKTSKNPRAVAQAAYLAGQKALPKYAHKFSRRDFTCAQLFAILVLRKFFKQDYRGTIEYLAEWAELREILELHDKLPHFTTPQKAAAKLLKDPLLRKLLNQTVAECYKKSLKVDDNDMAWIQRLDLTAADSTGFESGHCSKYFTRRRRQAKDSEDPNATEPVVYRRFPKLGIVVDCEEHIILSTHVGEGPKPDVDELVPLMENLSTMVWPQTMLLDAGYDSESNHELLRDYLEIESIIPAKIGRPTNKLPTGKWRCEMTLHFEEETYGQRWQVETVMFMLKSRQGESLTARSDQSRRHEMNLMALTHNIMIF